MAPGARLGEPQVSTCGKRIPIRVAPTPTGLTHSPAPSGPIYVFARFPWVAPTATHRLPLWGNSYFVPFEDVVVSRSRRHEKRIPLEKVKAELIKSGRLCG